MRLQIHIGPDPQIARRVQAATARIGSDWGLYPSGLGQSGQTALYLASLDEAHIDPLRAARGLSSEDRLQAFRRKTRRHLYKATSSRIVLCCDLLGRHLRSNSEIKRLHALIDGFDAPPEVLICAPDPAAGLVAHWSDQILWGRCRDLTLDYPDLATGQISRVIADPVAQEFPEYEEAPDWLDAEALARRWHPHFPDILVVDEPTLFETLELPPDPAPPLPSAQTLARAVAVNRLLRPALDAGLILPRTNRAKMIRDLTVPGPPLDAARIGAALAEKTPYNPLPDIENFAPEAFAQRWIARMTQVTRKADIGQPTASNPPLKTALPDEVKTRHTALIASRYAPHNRIAPPNTETSDYTRAARSPDRGIDRPERVLIACMKDEGPYLLEWLAFHREIGFDHILVYSNDCTDGTDTLLDALEPLGWLTHIDNTDWRGTSPQQAALNHAITLPLVSNADWVLHCDVDEFVNIRCGNGTLDDLFAAAPEATHWALTWRLFGSGRIRHIRNRPVIDQFSRCAPAYCPKPHTAWGFKTLGRQIGAYAKLSCHRPTRPIAERLDQAHWVNGSGQPMGAEVLQRGWRNSVKTIGYDLVQLNHYALRSQDSFLIKRKRGRALHVTRQIGRNYWLRMDWDDHEDLSIRRHLPRVEAALTELKSDPTIKGLHRAALDWHRARAQELRADPELAELIEQTNALRLTQSERAAYSLVLDMES